MCYYDKTYAVAAMICGMHTYQPMQSVNKQSVHIFQPVSLIVSLVLEEMGGCDRSARSRQ